MSEQSQSPHTKNDLEIDKLRLEIDDLRYGWRRTRWTTVLTAGVAILIAVLGFVGQQYVEHLNIAATVAAARENEFYRALERVTASSPNARIIAALDLAPFLRANQVTEGDADSQSAALSALIGQFGNEDDAKVLQTLGTILGSAGALALGKVADENRFASRDLAGEYGAYMELTHATNDCSVIGPLENTVSDAIAPLEYGRNQLGTNLMYLNCITSNGALFDEYWDRYNNENSPSQAPVNRRQELVQIRERIVHSAKLVAASSIALEEILKDPRNANLKDADLHDVVLYRVDLSEAHLEGVNLSGAYVEGRADKVDLSSANLSQTDLANLSLIGADLSGGGTNLNCTIFSDFRILRAKKVVGSSIILKNAPWWLAAMYSDGRYSQPSWLQAIFKNAPHGFERQHCGAGWFASQPAKSL